MRCAVKFQILKRRTNNYQNSQVQSGELTKLADVPPLMSSEVESYFAWRAISSA
jgi:hypothetical protein